MRRSLIIIFCLTFNSCGSRDSAPATDSSSTTPPISSPTAVTYNQSSLSYTVGVAIAANSAAVTPTAATNLTFTISPTLPPGLSLDTVTGSISGTPTGPAAIQNYTVTATNSAGSAQTSISIVIDYASGTFNMTGSMSLERVQGRAILLQSGAVMVYGGSDGNGYTSRTVELYDPTTGNFSTTGSTIANYGSATATLLTSGKVLLFGGDSTDSSSIPTSTAETYDPAAGTFSVTTGSMIATRKRAASARLNDGTVLIAGGVGSSCTGGTQPLSSAEIYDPANDTFTSTTGSLVSGRTNHSAILLQNGKVLITGGTRCTFSALFGWIFEAIATSELYDPATGTFSSTGDMVLARSQHKMHLFSDGRVLVIGGDGWASSAEIYDPNSGTFSLTGSHSLGTNTTSVKLADDSVLILAGQSAGIYSASSGAVTATGSMNYDRLGAHPILLDNGKVLVFGGGTGSQLTEAEIYNP